ncbi:MAG: SagB/ThcOx family dehydrogenase [bacterium]
MNSGRHGQVYQLRSSYFRGRAPEGAYGDADPGTYKSIPGALRDVPLPAPLTKDGAPLWTTMSARRSVRNYAKDPLRLDVLSQLLWAVNGVTKRSSHYQLRTAPSAGALYPVETYLVVNRVESLEPGAYHHNVLRFSLELLKTGRLGAALSDACVGQTMCERAAAVFIWTAVIARCRVRYHERAYRYVYMDAGHAAQNLCLAATALELGCCTIGAFFDEEVNALVGADGESEFSVYLAAVGGR